MAVNDVVLIENKWEIDKIRREKILNSTIKEKEDRILKMVSEAEDLNDMFTSELEAKDALISKYKNLNEGLAKKNKILTITLQTPRHHMKFLEEKGTLDHFVSAKLTGDNVEAKWALMDAAKEEINLLAK